MSSLKESPPIILLAGPTAVGKSAMALELARALETEIVNADSMQVFRHMDIGTAKPAAAERALIPHHLLDVADPDETFDASRYAELTRPVVESLLRRGKIPLVVGGTGLYMKALTKGICPGAPGDPDIRKELTREEAALGLMKLHEELLAVDPVLGGRIHPNDRQRILRALEVHRLTGKPLSHWQSGHRFSQKFYTTIKVFLYRERTEIYGRINARVHVMLEQGFLDEVRGLLEMGYPPALKTMQSLGYRQLVQHLMGECSLDSAVNQIQLETRRYAKRQMTWFRGDPEFNWFDARETVKLIKWTTDKASAF